jgi:hypothetical protein
MSKDLFVVKTPAQPKKLPIDPTTDDPFYRYQMYIIVDRLVLLFVAFIRSTR